MQKSSMEKVKALLILTWNLVRTMTVNHPTYELYTVNVKKKKNVKNIFLFIYFATVA